MPYRKTYRKKMYKRRGSRRVPKRRYRKYRSVSYKSQGLPRSITTQLNFSKRITMTATTTATAGYIFSMNNTYTCDVSAGNGQPYMRDQYEPLYSYCKVYGAKVTCYISSDSSVDAMVTLRNSTSNVTPASTTLEIERGAQQRIVTTDKPAIMKAYYSVAKTWGETKSRIRNDDLFSALVVSSSGPTRQAYILLATEAMDGSSGTQINVRVDIKYYIKFYDRKQQNIST